VVRVVCSFSFCVLVWKSHLTWNHYWIRICLCEWSRWRSWGVYCNHLVFWPTHWEIRSCRLGLSSWLRVSHSDLLRAGQSADRTPVGGDIFFTHSDWPWGPPSLLYSGYYFFVGGKMVRMWLWPLIASIADVKERVEPYIYSCPGPSWPVLGQTLPLTFTLHVLLSSCSSSLLILCECFVVSVVSQMI
jgi:hypothetical protein